MNTDMTFGPLLLPARLLALVPVGAPPRFSSESPWKMYSVLVGAAHVIAKITIHGYTLANQYGKKGVLMTALGIIIHTALVFSVIGMWIGCAWRKVSLMPGVLATVTAAPAQPRTSAVALQTTVVLIFFFTSGSYELYQRAVLKRDAYGTFVKINTILCLTMMAMEKLLLLTIVRAVRGIYAALNRRLLEIGASDHSKVDVIAFRIEHDKANHTLENTRRCFELQILSILCFEFANSTVLLYRLSIGIFYSKLEFNNIYSFAEFFGVATLTVILFRACDEACLEGRRTADVVQKILNKDDVSSKESTELQTFAMQLTHQQMNFDVLGCFALNNELIFTTLASAVVYVTVLVQFTISEGLRRGETASYGT